MFRIPKRESQQDKPRNVLLKLANLKMQKEVLEKAKNMKNVDGWNSTYISPDLTKTQREKAYQLRGKRRRRIQAGEKNLIIKNGSVVTNESRPFHQRWGENST